MEDRKKKEIAHYDQKFIQNIIKNYFCLLEPIQVKIQVNPFFMETLCEQSGWVYQYSRMNHYYEDSNTRQANSIISEGIKSIIKK